MPAHTHKSAPVPVKKPVEAHTATTQPTLQAGLLSTPTNILNLQRTIGNRATQQVMRAAPVARPRFQGRQVGVRRGGQPVEEALQSVQQSQSENLAAPLSEQELGERRAALIGRMQAAVTKAEAAHQLISNSKKVTEKSASAIRDSGVRSLKGRAESISERGNAPADRSLVILNDELETVHQMQERGRYFDDQYMEVVHDQHDLQWGSEQLNHLEACVRQLETDAGTMHVQSQNTVNEIALETSLAKAGFKSLEKTSWGDIRKSASDAAVALDKRKMKAEKYYTYQQADYEMVSQHLSSAKAGAAAAGLSEDLIEAIMMTGRSVASDSSEATVLSEDEAIKLVKFPAYDFVYQEKDQRKMLRKTGQKETVVRKDNVRLIQQIHLFGRVQQESEHRVDRATLFYGRINTAASNSLNYYDVMAALMKEPEAKRGDKAQYAGSLGVIWDAVLQSDTMRAQLKKDKERVGAESKKLNGFGQRQMHTVKGIGLKIVGGALGAGLGMISAGRYTIETESIGAGYQTQLKKENRAEKIQKLLTQVSSIWQGSGFAGNGLGGKHGRRTYAVMQLLSGLIPLFKPIFTTIGLASTIIGAILGLASLGTAAAPFAAITTTMFGINLGLTVIKTLTDLAMLAWSGIGAMAAKDPRARINTGGKWRQKALESSGNMIDLAGSSVAFIAAGVGGINPLNVLNPAAAYQGLLPDSIMGEATKGIVKGAGYTALDATGKAVQIGIPTGMGIGNTVVKATAGNMSQQTSGSHLLNHEQSRSSYQTPGEMQSMMAAARHPEEAGPEQDSQESASRLKEVGAGSSNMLENMRMGAALADMAQQQEDKARNTPWGKFKQVAKTAALVAWEIAATVTILPGLIEDISLGIYRAVKADKQQN